VYLHITVECNHFLRYPLGLEDFLESASNQLRIHANRSDLDFRILISVHFHAFSLCYGSQLYSRILSYPQHLPQHEHGRSTDTTERSKNSLLIKLPCQIPDNVQNKRHFAITTAPSSKYQETSLLSSSVTQLARFSCHVTEKGHSHWWYRKMNKNKQKSLQYQLPTEAEKRACFIAPALSSMPGAIRGKSHFPQDFSMFNPPTQKASSSVHALPASLPATNPLPSSPLTFFPTPGLGLGYPAIGLFPAAAFTFR